MSGNMVVSRGKHFGPDFKMVTRADRLKSDFDVQLYGQVWSGRGPKGYALFINMKGFGDGIPRSSEYALYEFKIYASMALKVCRIVISVAHSRAPLSNHSFFA
jgi:hypothetical protein